MGVTFPGGQGSITIKGTVVESTTIAYDETPIGRSALVTAELTTGCGNGKMWVRTPPAPESPGYCGVGLDSE